MGDPLNIALLQPGCEVAAQQPDRPDGPRLRAVREELAARPGPAGVRPLPALLARVAAGQAYVIQAGNCAEDHAERGGVAGWLR
jgi:3-deoxy-7-phosphoheptulonate synthase